MITNSSLTIYHKGYDDFNRTTKWIRHNYGTKDKNTVWFFGGKGASINKGYDNANDVEIRIPYSKNEGLNINDFTIGDIIVQGTLDFDINTQQDIKDYLVYNITSIKNNTFGSQPHIHIGGK